MVDSGVDITAGVVVAAAVVVELSVDTPGTGDEAAGNAVETGKGVVVRGVAAGPGAGSVEARSVNDLVRPRDVGWLGGEAVAGEVGEVLGVANDDSESAVEAALSLTVEVLETPVVLPALSVEAGAVRMIDVVRVTVAAGPPAVEAVDAPRVVVPVASEAVSLV